jgi:hypothetical protein
MTHVDNAVLSCGGLAAARPRPAARVLPPRIAQDVGAAFARATGSPTSAAELDVAFAIIAPASTP